MTLQCMSVKKSETCDVVFLQNNCPINVHQARTKEQKVSILFKRILGAKNPLKIQASLKLSCGSSLMGCSQGKYHHFDDTAGHGGRNGGTWGGRREGTLTHA